MKYYGPHYQEHSPSVKSKPCPNCGGTGFYCMGVENGQPYSRTGFSCFKCSGTGWITPKPRRKRCPGCGFLRTVEEMEEGHKWSKVSKGVQTFFSCNGMQKSSE